MKKYGFLKISQQCFKKKNNFEHFDSPLWVSFINDLCVMSVKVAVVLVLPLTPSNVFPYHYFFETIFISFICIILRLKNFIISLASLNIFARLFFNLHPFFSKHQHFLNLCYSRTFSFTPSTHAFLLYITSGCVSD